MDWLLDNCLSIVVVQLSRGLANKTAAGAGASHHSFDIKHFATHAVDNSVWKAMEIELTVVTSDSAPAFRIGLDSPQRALELVQKYITESRLPVFIPKRRLLHLLIGLRMTYDAHEAYAGCS